MTAKCVKLQEYLRRLMPRPRLSPFTLQQHASSTLEVPKDRPLKLAVVSDTHSQPHENALDIVSRLSPDAVLHGGDIGDLDVLTPLRALAPLLAVRGNIDGRGEVVDSIDLSLVQDGVTVAKILLVHYAVMGPRLRGPALALAKQYGAALVVCGHSHVPFIGRDRGIGVFNPGSIGPRRFGLPITLGVVEITRESMHARHIDCETGEVWSP